MNKILITLTAVLALGGTTLGAELTPRDRRDAERCGIAIEQWKAMSRKARTAARQEAKAKSLGMTVAEMKADRTRKEAEKVGCPLEKWAKMSVKERCAFRKQAKAQ